VKKLALILLLLFCSAAAAQEPEKVIYAFVKWEDGAYEITHIAAEMDYRTEINPSGTYLAKLKDSGGKTLYQLKVEKRVSIMPAPPDMNIEEKEIFYDNKYKYGSMELFLPHLENAETLSFEHGSKILAVADLKALCNSDGKCGDGENYLGCPEDCEQEKEDNYCLGETDGVCDPDCSAGIDSDCAGAAPGPEGTAEPEPGETWKGADFTGIAIFGGIAVVVLLIFLSKKRKSEPK